MSDLSDDDALIPCETCQPEQELSDREVNKAGSRKLYEKETSSTKVEAEAEKQDNGQQMRMLYERVRALEDENQQLSMQVHESAQVDPNPLTLQLSSEAGKKFADMAAKNRELEAGLEVEKTKVAEEVELIEELKEENVQLFSTIEKINGTENAVPDDSEAILSLKKQLAQAEREENKLLEQIGSERVSVSTLNLENEKLRIILQKETGQEFENLEPNEFEGRAEKIIELENKLKEANKSIKDLETGLTPLPATDKEMEERIKNEFREQLEDYETIIKEKNEQLSSAVEEHAALLDKYRKEEARVASLENDNAAIRSHVKTFVKKSEIDNIIISKFRSFIEKPENIATITQLQAANDIRASLAEEKLSGLMETMAGSDSQLEIIAAGAELEAYEYKEIIHRLRDDNKAIRLLLEQLLSDMLKILCSDEGVVNIFREMENAFRAEEAGYEIAIASYEQIIEQFNSHLQLDEEYKDIGDEFAAQFTGTQHVLQSVRDEKARDVLYDRLAEQALANRPEKRIRKVASAAVEVKPEASVRVSSVEKYREDAARRTPKPLPYDEPDSFASAGHENNVQEFLNESSPKISSPHEEISGNESGSSEA